MNKEKYIQMLVSQVSGNSSRKDEAQAEAWINESSENKAMYNDLKSVWKYSEVKDTEYSFDVDKAWNMFKERTNFDAVTKEVPVKINSNSFRKVAIYVSSMAAALIILFGLFFVIKNNEKSPEYLNYYSDAVRVDNPYILPDGSSLLMNKGCFVSYPEKFVSDSRVVNFVSGEAFFNVVHNPEKPMIIATGNVRVKVLGTSFDLCNNINSDEIVLFLESGKVLFYSINPENEEMLESIIVNPGQKAVYNKISGEIYKTEISNNNHMAWKTGILDFVATPMPEVLKVISNAYKVNFETEIPVDKFKVTARYENENPQSIMEALSVVFNINYEIEENQIRIY